MISSTGSVTSWINGLKGGDREATRKLWERYFQRSLGFMRKKFKNFPRRMADEEDVVLHAFASFFREAEDGRLPAVSDRASFWRLLLLKTSQTALDFIRVENALKRTPTPREGRRITAPDEAAAMADLWERLLHFLGDDRQGHLLRKIAIWKMEDYTNGEIAKFLDVTERTVERKLGLIRKTWKQGFKHEIGL